MNFIDLFKQQEQLTSTGITLKEDMNKRIKSVVDNGKFILGPEVEILEKTLAKYVGVSNCIAVSSGTDALLVALMALDIGPGDEVITTPFSFISTAEAIALIGAKPIFVDIEEDTYNIDPKKIEKAITTSTKAIIAVSLYGQPADFYSINKIAIENNLFVIEDGAQSFGAKQNNKRSCALSYIGTTSFFPSKPLGGYGDGGACFCDDIKIAEKMRMISKHGQVKRYSHSRIGINGRLDTLQAAILLSKFEIFDNEVNLRQIVGLNYNKYFSAKGFKNIPKIKKGNTSVYAQYTVEVSDREKVQKMMLNKGIPTSVHYPTILPEQKAFEKLFKYDCSNFPIALDKSRKVLSLPMHPYLESSEQTLVVDTLLDSIN